MSRWICAIICATLLMAQSSPPDSTRADQPQSQPTSQPAPAPGGGLPVPAQAEILKSLLGRDSRPTPIRPQESAELTSNAASAACFDPD